MSQLKDLFAAFLDSLPSKQIPVDIGTRIDHLSAAMRVAGQVVEDQRSTDEIAPLLNNIAAWALSPSHEDLRFWAIEAFHRFHADTRAQRVLESKPERVLTHLRARVLDLLMSWEAMLWTSLGLVPPITEIMHPAAASGEVVVWSFLLQSIVYKSKPARKNLR